MTLGNTAKKMVFLLLVELCKSTTKDFLLMVNISYHQYFVLQYYFSSCVATIV